MSDENIIEIEQTGIYTADEMVEMSGLNPDEYRVERYKVKKWGAQTADRVIELGSSTVSLERLPQYVTHPPQLPSWHRKKPTLVDDGDVSTVLLIPDSQNGYRRRADGVLEPMHDRRAWDLAVTACRVLKPDTVVLLGDMLDLAPWSTRWPITSDLRDTTSPAIAELHWWLRQVRYNAPNARVVYVEGNHEHRIHRAMNERMPEACGLTLPGAAHPHLSIPTLLGLDALSIEYVGPYGADFWLWPDQPNPVQVTHGDTHGSGGGATVAKVLKQTDHSRVFGHVHRRECASRTVHGPSTHYERHALTPGCLCRVDGEVPASVERVDWQQGLGVLRRVCGDVFPEVLPIQNGRAVINGRVYEAGDPLPAIAAMFPSYRWC